MKNKPLVCDSLLLISTGLTPTQAALEELTAINDFSSNQLDILLSYNTTQSITIQENNFDSAFNSIMLFDNTTQQLITVTGNHLKSRHDEAGVPAGKHGIGIYYAYNAKLNLNVDQNELTDFPLGIRIINADKLSNSIFNVTQNTINFNFDESRLGENLYRGIFMSNSSGAKVADNTITWNSGLTNPVDINSHADQVQGIRMEKVQTSDIKDNTVTTCGTGMFMQGACNGTYITCNQLDNNYPGIGFDAVVLPQQGDLCQPANNRWIGTYTNTIGKVEEYTPGTSFYYYYSGAANDPANQEFPLPPALLLINPVHIGSCIPADLCTNNGGSQHMMAEDTTKKDEELESLVDQTSASQGLDFPLENEYTKQEYAFKTMQDVPELINSTDRSEFMGSTGQNNIGKFQEVKELIQSGDSSLASIKNILIIDTNLIEYNKKVVNNAYLNSPNDTLTPADSVIFDQMQHQLALQGGEAVFWTRGKMRSDIEDNYISSQRRTNPNQNNIPLANRISIFPNPAQNLLSVNGLAGECEIEIFDSYGKLISNNKTSDKSIQLSLSNISNGIYFLKVKNNSTRYFRTTFIVIK